jgi:hypothetical protein
MSRSAGILVVSCLLGGGNCRFLGAQTVSVSVWSSEMDHSQESVIVFQSQSSEGTDAYIHVSDDILAQQIAEPHAALTGNAGERPGDSAGNGGVEVPPSMDQEADTVIINPLKSGAETIGSTRGSNTDFLLESQFFRVVKVKAYRIVSGVTGSDALESLAFRNPDGTHALFVVNHSKSAVSLEAIWKDRLFTFTQAGKSLAIYAWDPKSQLVSLVPKEAQIPAKGSVFVEAKCSNVSPVGIDLGCESPSYYCSVSPVRFTCSSQQDSVMLSVTVDSTDENAAGHGKPGFVTITAAPDVGEPTSLRIPCLGAGR